MTSHTIRDLLGLLAASLLLFGLGLGARDLWNPNEPVYGLAVQEMFEAGEWLVPTANGEEFVEKPILYYWGALAASHLAGGVNETTLRVPLVLTSTLAVILVYIWLLPALGRRWALITAGLCATEVGFFMAARTIQMDSLVAVATLGAIIPLTRMLDGKLRPSRAWGLAGLAAGLGFAAKGPVGLALPALIWITYCVWSKRSPWMHLSAMPWAVLLFLLVAAPWYVALWATGRSDLVVEFLVNQNFNRYLSPWHHHQPWWYYLKYFFLEFAPWSLFVPLTIGLRSDSDAQRSVTRLAWIWIAVIVLFFSLSSGKRSPYILPIAPAIALLTAQLFSSWIAGKLSLWRARATATVVALLATLISTAGGAFLIYALEGATTVDGVNLRLSIHLATVVLLVSGLSLWSLCIIGMRRPGVQIGGLLAVFFLIYITFTVGVFPALNPLKSARNFGIELNEIVAPDEPIASYRVWQVHAAYPYYAHRTIPSLETVEELNRYWAEAEGFLLVEQQHRIELSQRIPLPEPALSRKIGSKKIFLYSMKGAVHDSAVDRRARLQREGSAVRKLASNRSGDGTP
jgi:4-amino-4-deoxy-L-arabinose transferase-like glycosyltransferase